MFRNYLKTAVRNFLRQRLFSVIHLIGLAVGLASALLILLYIQDEMSFDSMHPYAEDTYRIGNQYTNEEGEIFYLDGAPSAWSGELKARYPEVVTCLRHTWLGYPVSITNEADEVVVLSEQVTWTESSWPDVFDFPLVYGTKASAFGQPNSISLSRSSAMALFGDIDPVGKPLLIEHPFFNESMPAIVGAVYENYPSNSHMRPDFLPNLELMAPEMGEENFQSRYVSGWEHQGSANYIVTAPEADMEKLLTGLIAMKDENTDEEYAHMFTPVIRQMKDIHFDSEFEWVTEGMGDLRYVYMFGTIALMLIIIACINYMNLATARAARRAKEIGMRKALGSTRGLLIQQFLGESFLMVILSSILAMGLMMIMLIPFNKLAQKSFEIADLFSLEALGITVAVILLVGFLAGLYPALILSGFKPVEVFKGQVSTGKRSELFRKGLVIFQFAISVILIVSTVIVVRQMSFLQNSTIGKDGDQMISIRFGGVADAEKFPTFKNLVLQDPEIEVLTMGNHLPRQDFFGGITYNIRIPGQGDEAMEWDMLNVDYDFHRAFDLELITGRLFEETDQGSGHKFLMNQTAVTNLGMTADEAIGLSINLDFGDTTENGQVIGIIEDFSYRSVMHTIDPLLITIQPHPIDKIVYAKLPPGKVQEKIASLEASWEEVYPGAGFDYWFVDEEFARMYTSESRLSDLIQVFALIAILVACLGIFGLSAFLAERRTKEMGVRKVLGARTHHIMVLLSGTFVQTVLIACLLALPVAWYLMNSWLENFVYRADMTWWIFVGTVILVILLTLLTTAYETMRAAWANPLDNMRED